MPYFYSIMALPIMDGIRPGQSIVRLIIAYLWLWAKLFSNNAVSLYRTDPLLLEKSGICYKAKLFLNICACREFSHFVNEGAGDVLCRGYLPGDGFRDDPKKLCDSFPMMEDIFYLIAVFDISKGTRLSFHAIFLLLLGGKTWQRLSKQRYQSNSIFIASEKASEWTMPWA